MADGVLLTCYNRGCAVGKYVEQDNHDAACLYHTGEPVFHDLDKGWSCCEVRVKDFQDFLGLKGCTSGRHSNVKPVAAPKPDAAAQKASDAAKLEERRRAAKAAEVVPITDEMRAAPLQKVGKVSVGASAKAAYKRLQKRLDAEKAAAAAGGGGGTATATAAGAAAVAAVAEDTLCVNNGCEAKYTAGLAADAVCMSHPGQPVFHEGFKFWSCCERKTGNFDEFLAQKGCVRGTHKWVADAKAATAAGEYVLTDCRTDWFQTANYVTLSVYCKGIHPDSVEVEVNTCAVRVAFNFDGNKRFERQYHTARLFDAGASEVEVLGTKLEVSLKKPKQTPWNLAKMQELPQQS